MMSADFLVPSQKPYNALLVQSGKLSERGTRAVIFFVIFAVASIAKYEVSDGFRSDPMTWILAAGLIASTIAILYFILQLQSLGKRMERLAEQDENNRSGH